MSSGALFVLNCLIRAIAFRGKLPSPKYMNFYDLVVRWLRCLMVSSYGGLSCFVFLFSAFFISYLVDGVFSQS